MWLRAGLGLCGCVSCMDYLENMTHTGVATNSVLVDAGWDIRGGVTRLWAGDRDLTQLLASKDPGSRIALETVIRCATMFEQDFGKKTIDATI